MKLNTTRTIVLSIIATVTALVSASVAYADPVESAATFNTVYVPRGFDSNDNVQFVGEGLFENACYRPAPTTVQLDQAKHTITVGPVAYKFSGLCLQVVLPFDRTIDLGALKAGNYTIIQSPDGKTLGQVNVVQSRTDTPDDFLYAPVSQAFFHQVDNAGNATVTISGEFPNSCMKINELKVDVQPKAIVVQPIAVVQDNGNCKPVSTPFEQTVKVSGVAKGRYLLHVRSMNGKAFNNLVTMD